MDLSDLLQNINTTVRHCLVSNGFRQKAMATWIRSRENDINLIAFQGHSKKKLFCVNLGIHYSFLPRAGIEAPLDLRKFSLLDCELKLRLTERPTENDQWWPIASSSIEEVRDLVCHRALAIFEMYRFDGPIRKMDAGDIEGGDLGLLKSMTPVRACLLLARMHEYLGNRAKCIECATLGLERAGRMAVGPKEALADILRRV